MVEEIIWGDKVLAIIIYKQLFENGIHFFTPSDFTQQLAYIRHPAGKIIEPHIHNIILRQVYLTQEVLFLKKGKLKVDFYDDNKNYLESRILTEGDAVLLSRGGHGFEVLEEVEMIEVKQGPYAGASDKIRFIPADKNDSKEGVKT